jgi:cell division protein FtsQ
MNDSFMGLKGRTVSPKRSINKFRLALLLFVLLLSVYLFLHSSIFNVTQIEVLGNNKVSKEEVLALSGLTPGINIFGFNEAACAQAIEAHPMIKSVAIARKLNRSVAITINERQIWALMPYGDLFLCVDDTGICFDKLNHTTIDNVPIITMDQMPEFVNLGQAVNTQATDMVKQVWQALPADEQQAISDFHYQNQENTLNIYTIKGTEILFGNLDRLDEKVKTLAQVIQLENDMEQRGIDTLEYVDIRFKGEPVLKTRM